MPGLQAELEYGEDPACNRPRWRLSDSFGASPAVPVLGVGIGFDRESDRAGATPRLDSRLQQARSHAAPTLIGLDEQIHEVGSITVDGDGNETKSSPRLLGHEDGLGREPGRRDGQFLSACIEELRAVAVNGL